MSALSGMECSAVPAQSSPRMLQLCRTVKLNTLTRAQLKIQQTKAINNCPFKMQYNIYFIIRNASKFVVSFGSAGQLLCPPSRANSLKTRTQFVPLILSHCLSAFVRAFVWRRAGQSSLRKFSCAKTLHVSGRKRTRERNVATQRKA